MNNHLKPLNTVLDQLNYITLLTNIPSAAYDSDKIKDIEINLAKKGETFTGFDQKKYSLTTDDIVIRSDGEIICLAGILGDNKYGVNEQTKNIIVELANFNYQMIRNTATKLNITTDAARRFSKINSTYCSRLAAQLCYQYFNKKSIE
jgi:phenylalanyl-tRNA synthetase beta chain